MPAKALPKQYEGWYRIATAAQPMGIAHAQYVRQLVQKKFQHEDVINPVTDELEKGAIKLDMGSYKVWVINPTIVENYGARTTVRSGLRRYLVRFDSTIVDPDSLAVLIKEAVAGFYKDKDYADLTEAEFSFAPAYKKKKSSSTSASSAKGTFDPAEIPEDATVVLDFLEASND